MAGMEYSLPAMFYEVVISSLRGLQRLLHPRPDPRMADVAIVVGFAVLGQLFGHPADLRLVFCLAEEVGQFVGIVLQINQPWLFIGGVNQLEVLRNRADPSGSVGVRAAGAADEG